MVPIRIVISNLSPQDKRTLNLGKLLQNLHLSQILEKPFWASRGSLGR